MLTGAADLNSPLPKKFEGRVPLFLNRLMGLPVDQQKLVSFFSLSCGQLE